jgi:ATP-dependent Clp protease adaptor protein ClpS
MDFSYETSKEEETGVIELSGLDNRLILHNDNTNTFEWVIKTLVDVCKHTLQQAEQCAYIIHYKGKYAVKHGNFEILKPLKDEITDRGINATIE